MATTSGCVICAKDIEFRQEDCPLSSELKILLALLSVSGDDGNGNLEEESPSPLEWACSTCFDILQDLSTLQKLLQETQQAIDQKLSEVKGKLRQSLVNDDNDKPAGYYRQKLIDSLQHGAVEKVECFDNIEVKYEPVDPDDDVEYFDDTFWRNDNDVSLTCPTSTVEIRTASNSSHFIKLPQKSALSRNLSLSPNGEWKVELEDFALILPPLKLSSCKFFIGLSKSNNLETATAIVQRKLSVRSRRRKRKEHEDYIYENDGADQDLEDHKSFVDEEENSEDDEPPAKRIKIKTRKSLTSSRKAQPKKPIEKEKAPNKIYPRPCHLCPEELNKTLFNCLGLRKHMRKVHPRDPRRIIKSCEICDRPFIHLASLRSHSWTHFNEEEVAEKISKGEKDPRISSSRKNICEICGKSFKYAEGWKSHLQNHLDPEERPKFPCDICSKICNNSRTLSIHRRLTHFPESVNCHQCRICDRKYFSKTHLTEHMSAAHGEKRQFPCDVEGCSLEFAGKEGLKRHKVTHLPPDWRPFNCHLCPEAYRYKKNLTRHLKSTHEIRTERKTQNKNVEVATCRQMFPCEICEGVFGIRSMRTKHWKAKHGFVHIKELSEAFTPEEVEGMKQQFEVQEARRKRQIEIEKNFGNSDSSE